uniref:Uroporphyrinogen decarboxylase n=1 Tax=Anthurium amnicola TaxID=1678845 RepID=A0A1D1ZD20_9ARAE
MGSSHSTSGSVKRNYGITAKGGKALDKDEENQLDYESVGRGDSFSYSIHGERSPFIYERYQKWLEDVPYYFSQPRTEKSFKMWRALTIGVRDPETSLLYKTNSLTLVKKE